MSQKIKFLTYLQDKLDVSTSELADFLFIDKRTLYNYKSLSIEELPNKVREKMLIFFQGFEEFYVDKMTVEDIYLALSNANQKDITYIRSRFLDTAMIRKKNLVVTNTEELLHKISEKREVNSLDEFLIDLKILLQYSNLTKGYIYSLFEIIISKMDSENDYQLLDYINKYEKGEKSD